MESNSTQGLAVLVFLVAFTFLGGVFYLDGAFFSGTKLLLIALFVIGAAFSVALFRRVKEA